ATNVLFTTGTFTLGNTLNPGTTVPCTASALTGSFSVVCADIQSGGVPASIDQGGYVTLELKAVIESPKVTALGSSTLQTSLNGLGDRSSVGSVEWNDGDQAFTWVDVPDSSVRSTVYRIP
ncbi:MAG: hypothetical protein PHO54_05940, partial [Candidatus Peribacteraceae bacterium]|nr:hypothetical protein [Candidatus Peribacteraceae bacterium]